jgi:DNA primase
MKTIISSFLFASALLLTSEIKSRVSILDLLTRLGIPVNKSGFIFSIYKKENTPSLKLYPQKNSYYDYAAGKGGDIFNFYMDYFSVPFSQAVSEISNLFGLPVTSDFPQYTKSTSTPSAGNKPQLLPRSEVFELLPNEYPAFLEITDTFAVAYDYPPQVAEQFAKSEILKIRSVTQKKIFRALYEYCLSYTQTYAPFWDYLQGPQRKLTRETIITSKLFVTPPYVIEYLIANYSHDELFISGLFNRKGGFVFTSHRLIIPYLENGEIVYLRGRILPIEETNPPATISKYISLSNFSGTLSSKRFYNSDVLQTKTNENSLVITEGEFDCMIAAQNGIRAIGIPGTGNFPTAEINTLSGNKIFLCFDNDDAGSAAIEKIAPLFPYPVKQIKLHNAKDLTEVL